MIHSILVSEVKDTKSHVLQALGNIPNKKLVKFYLQLNFKNFKKEKMEIFYVDCYDISFLGIDIIEFDVKIISELVFTII